MADFRCIPCWRLISSCLAYCSLRSLKTLCDSKYLQNESSLVFSSILVNYFFFCNVLTFPFLKWHNKTMWQRWCGNKRSDSKGLRVLLEEFHAVVVTWLLFPALCVPSVLTPTGGLSVSISSHPVLILYSSRPSYIILLIQPRCL